MKSIMIDMMLQKTYMEVGKQDEDVMAQREQFAWVWLVTMLTTYTGYFTAVAILGETSFMTQIVLFAITATVQVAVIAAASLTLQLRGPGAPKADERDRAIEHRASASAYQVLILGMIVVGCLMPFTHGGWRLFHAAVFAIALAEIVRHALIVSCYRRGVHG